MHDAKVQKPLEDIAGDEKNWDRHPFPQLHNVQVASVKPQCCEANDVDHHDVNRAVVPAGNS